MNTDHLLEAAISAVRGAMNITRSVQHELLNNDTAFKEDESPVTIADYAAQAFINGALCKAAPEIPIMGEEDADDLHANPEMLKRISAIVNNEVSMTETEVAEFIDLGNYPGGAEGVFWTLDPIDGTKGFLRGDQYAIALGLIIDGKVMMGLLGCPNLVSPNSGEKGFLAYAVDGQGAFEISENGDIYPLKVDRCDKLEDARLCESVESGHSSHSASFQIAEKLGIKNEPYRIDSQCKYAAVAFGAASIYLRLPVKKGYQEKIWDHAGGYKIVEEAGGTLSDIHGMKLDFSQGHTLQNNEGVIATNGQFHQEVVDTVVEVIRARRATAE